MSESGMDKTNSSKPHADLESLPLLVHTQTLTSSSQTMSVTTKEVTYKSQAVKRSIRQSEEEEQQNDETLISPTNSGEWETFSSSRRKSRRISYTAYREPPVLQSLDSDALKNLFDPSSLSDSQNSEVGNLSLSRTSAFSSSRVTPTDNLGSLGDIIQQYNNATLNSMKGFEFAFDEGDDAQSSPQMLSPVSREVGSEQTSILKTFSATLSTITTDTNISSCDSTSENAFAALKTVQSECKNERDVQEQNLMSLAVDISTISKEEKEIHVTEIQISETQSTTKSLSVSEHPPQLKTCEEQLDTVGAENKAQCSSGKQKEKCNKDKTPDTVEKSAFSERLEDRLEHKQCKKNQGHQGFYSPSELQVCQLPVEIQHEDSVTFLNCMSQLVVQITVNSTSPARGEKDQYKKYFGTNKERHGSGFISSVDDHIVRHRCKKEDCPHADEDANSSYEESLNITSPTFSRNLSNMSTCSSASTSSSGRGCPPHYAYSGVCVHTNKHVIFDKSEADSAFVKFFYNTPDGKEIIHGHVGAILGVNNKQDHVILHVMSHDRSLFDLIGLVIKNAHSSYTQMVESTHKTHQLHGHKHQHSWVAVISHPHGLTKAITVGRIIREVTEATRVVKYYDAATCPGSSGGLVLTPTLLRLQWPGAVHSSYDSQSNCNVTLDSRFPDLDFRDIGKINRTIAFKKKKKSSHKDLFKW